MEKEKIAGFLLINKPKGISSFAVVRHVKKLLGRRIRVGHTGTLDPFATGLLIIAIDRSATRQSERFITLDKTYIAKAKLGELTDTLDLVGTVLQKEKVESLTQEKLEAALASLGSSYLQIPPIYSALKHEGVPLYILARQKKLSDEELQAITKHKEKEVQLHKLTLLDFSPPFFTLKAQVSHGTYIRVLVNDIAKRAGTVATTYDLERTNIGPFSLDRAIYLQQLNSREDVEKFLIPDLNKEIK